MACMAIAWPLQLKHPIGSILILALCLAQAAESAAAQSAASRLEEMQVRCEALGCSALRGSPPGAHEACCIKTRPAWDGDMHPEPSTTHAIDYYSVAVI